MSGAFAQRVDLKQYFTDAIEVNSAMCTLLGDVSDLELLEPSVGSGSLLGAIAGRPKRIDAVDVDPFVLEVVRGRMDGHNLNVHRADFIDIFAQGLLGTGHPIAERSFDAVISNPPFGLYFEPAYRRQLKRQFPNLYVRESYGLFFVFSLLRLRQGGRYVFLLPDTFLTSNNHTPLRQFIYENARPDTIIRFPSSRFETINFAYGNLCIISGWRAPVDPTSPVTWIEAFNDGLGLLSQPSGAIRTFTGTELYENLKTGWRCGMVEHVPTQQGWLQLGQLAECRTGIYTGDNERFVGYDPARVSRRLNGHPIIWEQDVCTRDLTSFEKSEGLDDVKAAYVPLIRGGHRDFNDSTAWCIRWNRTAVAFYRSDKRARLQNASFYFRPGLAVPMVTTKRLTASLMDRAIFDQGVVGVFPHNQKTRDALLLYLNSSYATKLRNDIVNGSANNSANYLKRLPVPDFNSGDILKACKVVSQAIKSGSLPRRVCDDFVESLLPS